MPIALLQTLKNSITTKYIRLREKCNVTPTTYPWILYAIMSYDILVEIINTQKYSAE